MPIYEYECECGKVFDAIQGINDEPLTVCECGKEGCLKKKVSRSTFKLKGSGWAKDGYAKPSVVLRDKGSGDEIKKSV